MPRPTPWTSQGTTLDRVRLQVHYFCMGLMVRLILPLGALILAAFLIAGQLRHSPTESVVAPVPAAFATLPPESAIEFKAWVSAEAQQMSVAQGQASDKQTKLVALAKKLNPSQRRELLNLARDPRSGTPEKVLSTYMLVEAGSTALHELRQLIASPVRDQDPIGSQRDKTLRIMALDGLSSRALSDPAAQEALARSLDEIQDPDVKSYARQKMQQVQVH